MLAPAAPLLRGGSAIPIMELVHLSKGCEAERPSIMVGPGARPGKEVKHQQSGAKMGSLQSDTIRRSRCQAPAMLRERRAKGKALISTAQLRHQLLRSVIRSKFENAGLQNLYFFGHECSFDFPELAQYHCQHLARNKVHVQNHCRSTSLHCDLSGPRQCALFAIGQPSGNNCSSTVTRPRVALSAARTCKCISQSSPVQLSQSCSSWRQPRAHAHKDFPKQNLAQL